MQLEHEKECDARPIECSMCSETVKFRDAKDHLVTSCPKVVIPCPNSCNEHLTRGLLANHLKDDCPNQEIPCVFARFGCPNVSARKLLAQHELDAIKDHHALLTNSMKQHQQVHESDYKNAIPPGIFSINLFAYRLIPRMRPSTFYTQNWTSHLEAGDLVRYKGDYALVVLAREIVPEMKGSIEGSVIPPTHRLYTLKLPLHSGCSEDVARCWISQPDLAFCTTPFSLLTNPWYPTLMSISKWDLIRDTTFPQYLVPSHEFDRVWITTLDLDEPEEESEIEEDEDI